MLLMSCHGSTQTKCIFESQTQVTLHLTNIAYTKQIYWCHVLIAQCIIGKYLICIWVSSYLDVLHQKSSLMYRNLFVQQFYINLNLLY